MILSIAFFSFFVLNIVSCTHFRGGTIMWKPVSTNGDVVTIGVTTRLGFRYSYFFYDWCNVGSSYGIYQFQSDYPNQNKYVSDYNNAYCTYFSEIEDWSYGEATIYIDFNQEEQQYTQSLQYAGGNWISTLLNGHDSEWSLISRINFIINSRTNKLNQSPVTSMFPIIRIPIGIRKQLLIPAADADGDIIKCRWSQGTNRYDECYEVCEQPPNVLLDEKSCSLLFNLPIVIGLYAIKIQIEDFQDENSNIPMSSVPLQFLVEAYEETNSTIINPTFESPTPTDKSCVLLPLGSTYDGIVKVNSNNFDDLIVEIQITSPQGLIKSELYSESISSTIKYVTLKWTPTQIGVSIICFKGITESLKTTEQRCISVAVGLSDCYQIIVPTMQTTSNIVSTGSIPTTTLISSSTHTTNIITSGPGPTISTSTVKRCATKI